MAKGVGIPPESGSCTGTVDRRHLCFRSERERRARYIVEVARKIECRRMARTDDRSYGPSRGFRATSDKDDVLLGPSDTVAFHEIMPIPMVLQHVILKPTAVGHFLFPSASFDDEECALVFVAREAKSESTATSDIRLSHTDPAPRYGRDETHAHA